VIPLLFVDSQHGVVRLPRDVVQGHQDSQKKKRINSRIDASGSGLGKIWGCAKARNEGVKIWAASRGASLAAWHRCGIGKGKRTPVGDRDKKGAKKPPGYHMDRQRPMIRPFDQTGRWGEKGDLRKTFVATHRADWGARAIDKQVPPGTKTVTHTGYL